MAAPAFNNDDEEKPLDPIVENVRRRMMRLMIISIGVMMIGLMAVLGAIVYKFNTSDDESPKTTVQKKSSLNIDTGYPEGNISLPAGFTIESSSIAGDRILLNVRDGNGMLQIAVFDMLSAKIIAIFPVVNQK